MTTTQHQMTINFFKRRLSNTQHDINDLTAMYLQSVSTKNVQLAEQCEIALRKARRNQREAARALKQYQRPIRKTV
jgi:hypothetical protein